jgi:hypothetical protein
VNPLDERQIGQHVLILGWLHIIGSAIFFAIAAFLFVLLTGIGAVSGDAEAVTVLSIVATAIGTFLCLLALPGILAGIGLLMRKNWGRILAIVVGILNLINFPIGTVIGAYTLWVLLQNAAIPYFENAPTPLRMHEGHPVS